MSYVEELDCHVTWDLVVQDMLGKGTIELVMGKLECFYAHVFLVSKDQLITLQRCIGTIWAVMWLCAQLGIQINLPKLDLVPSQRNQYLGIVLDSVRALVFPLPERVSWFLLVVQSFLEDRAPPVSLWSSLLSHLASRERLVPSSRVCSWSLQWCLKKHWRTALDPPGWRVPPSQLCLAEPPGGWIWVIQRVREDVSEEDMCLVQVKAYEVRALATSALFKKIQAGTWKSMSTFASFYLRDITHQYLDTFRDIAHQYLDTFRDIAHQYLDTFRDIAHQYLDTFSLGPVVSALRVIQ
ncbi:hypothetical protein E2C01_046823 [Portunus trituberculatus]|uniref:Uncharacterized protein n=1 Tax=Portunus trituberculatus TaxID=210409 RepID=A0A5B7FZJ7_PORTR|nr:hypothetical protein [Portunus trituberculatus]